MAMAPTYNEPIASGVPEALIRTVVSVPPKDIGALKAMLDSRNDIAGLILIADQAGKDYLQAARDLCDAKGIVLIFDEVVTGFRYAPGGAQEYYGVTPDLTTMAKILAGGLPGGAVAGKAELFAPFMQSDDQ